MHRQLTNCQRSENIVIIGSGLVGLDAAYGLMETGKNVSIVEMADRILPVQLDKTAAKEYRNVLNLQELSFILEEKQQKQKWRERKNYDGYFGQWRRIKIGFDYCGSRSEKCNSRF